MAIWTRFSRTLLGGEEELDYPLHIRRAFSWVGVMENNDADFARVLEATGNDQPYYGDFMRENVRRFIQRWGGWEEVTLLRVLHEDPGIDRLKALFALGYSPLPHALEIVAPYLESANRLERCAAGCVMGVHQDERVFSVLEDYYLHDAVDEFGEPLPEAEFWYQGYYAVLALTLAHWGPPEVTDILRSALLRILSPEHKCRFRYAPDEAHQLFYAALGSRGEEARWLAVYYRVPNNLFYALGSRGVISVWQDVELSVRERRMALLSLASGYLHLYKTYETLSWDLLQDEVLQGEVITVWKEHFGLSNQEIQECFASIGIKRFL